METIEQISNNNKHIENKKDEIKKYMETDEYKTGIQKFLFNENKNIDELFEKYYSNEYIKYSEYVHYTDIEKLALAFQSMNNQRKQEEIIKYYLPKNEFFPNTKYLLFSIGCNNVIFVPEKEFNEIRGDILDMLRENAETSYDENGTVLHEFVKQSKQSKQINNFDFQDGDGDGNYKYDRFVSGMKVFIEGNDFFPGCKNIGYKYGNLKDPIDKCDTEIDIDRKWYVKSVICRYDGKYITPFSLKNGTLNSKKNIIAPIRA